MSIIKHRFLHPFPAPDERASVYRHRVELSTHDPIEPARSFHFATMTNDTFFDVTNDTRLGFAENTSAVEEFSVAPELSVANEITACISRRSTKPRSAPDPAACV